MSGQDPGSPQGSPERAAVYQELCGSYHRIDDFRSKLLALLPLASAAGLFLLLNDKFPAPGAIEGAAPILVPVGVFGVLVTLGLFAYEIYGIRKCGALIDAGIELEWQMNVPGQFRSRPHHVINELFAAGVIYPAVLAGWLYLVLYAGSAGAARLIAGAVFFVGFACMLAWDVHLVREARGQREERTGRPG